LEIYTPAEAATFAGTMTGLQDAGELLWCLPKMDLEIHWNVGIHGAEEGEHNACLFCFVWPAAIAH
jgi:hypothetical protein